MEVPRSLLPGRPPVVGAVGRHRARRSSAARSRSPASRGTSRRRCSARRASRRARPRTPTAPGRSCSRTSATRRSPRGTGCCRRCCGSWARAGRAAYALEGSVFIAGAAVQWLRDGLRAVSSAAEVEELMRGVEDTGGVYLVPAFVGLGAPYWDPRARGLLIGMTRGTGLPEIARATIESIAYQVADVVEAMDGRPRRPAHGAARRRRGGPQRRPAAVPGGHPGHPGGAAAQHRDDGLGRRVAGRSGGWFLGVARRAGRDPRRRSPLRAGDGRGSPARAPGGWHRAVERSKGWATD